MGAALAKDDWLAGQFARCWPMLEPALAYGADGVDRAFVWCEIEGGRAQLWPGETAALVSKIKIHPDGSRSVFSWLAGGKLDEVLRIRSEAVIPWAKEQGCTRHRLIGRRGWLKVGLPMKEEATVMVEDI